MAEHPQDGASTSTNKIPVTFLDLPPELRNRIYDLSGCLQLYSGGGYDRGCVRGDYTAADHYRIHACQKGVDCEFAEWPEFRETYKKALILVNPGDERTTRAWRVYKSCGDDYHGRGAPPERRSVNREDVPYAQPELTRANKQIRSETLPIFFGNHRFVFRVVDADAEKTLEWLDIIGPVNAGFLRDVVLIYSKKKTLHSITRTLRPEMRRRGVDVAESSGVVEAKRIEYPFWQRDDWAIARAWSRDNDCVH